MTATPKIARVAPAFNDEAYARQMSEPQRSGEITGVLELKTGEIIAGYLEPGGAAFGVPVVRVRVPESKAAGITGFIRLYPWAEVRSVTPTDSTTAFEMAAEIDEPAIPVPLATVAGEVNWPEASELDVLDSLDDSEDDDDSDYDPALR
jgi:hypothetical protein